MESLDTVLTHVAEAATNLDRQTVLRAQTAIEELFANSVTHGNRDHDPQASVWLEAVEVNGDLRIRYEDAFAPFNPLADFCMVCWGTRKRTRDRRLGCDLFACTGFPSASIGGGNSEARFVFVVLKQS